MKKLLVFMLCAMLAVPVVGMNVHAEGESGSDETIAEPTADEMAVKNASVLNDYLKNLN